MTKKDYEVIALGIKSVTLASLRDNTHERHGFYTAKYLIANAIAHSLYFDNSRFDKEEFLKACGIK